MAIRVFDGHFDAIFPKIACFRQTPKRSCVCALRLIADQAAMDLH